MRWINKHFLHQTKILGWNLKLLFSYLKLYNEIEISDGAALSDGQSADAPFPPSFVASAMAATVNLWAVAISRLATLKKQ